MTSDRADDFNGGIKEADGALGDNDDLNVEGKRDRATSTAQAVVDQAHWHYYHVSTP
jgi:uncharacterized protein YjbJ (UPF0337 family)